MKITVKDFPILGTSPKTGLTKQSFKCPANYNHREDYTQVKMKNGITALYTSDYLSDDLTEEDYWVKYEQMVEGIQKHEDGFDFVMQGNKNKGTILIFLKID